MDRWRSALHQGISELNNRTAGTASVKERIEKKRRSRTSSGFINIFSTSNDWFQSKKYSPRREVIFLSTGRFFYFISYISCFVFFDVIMIQLENKSILGDVLRID